MATLGKAIEARTGISVEVLDPFRQVDLSSRGLDPAYLRANAPLAAVSVGLALRRLDEN